jgi:hypothetical protein
VSRKCTKYFIVIKSTRSEIQLKKFGFLLSNLPNTNASKELDDGYQTNGISPPQTLKE